MISSRSTWSSTSPVGSPAFTFSGARAAIALSLEDEFVANVVGRGGSLGCMLGVDDELGDAGRVAQVDEDEPAVVTAPGDPAGELEPLPHVLSPQLARAEIAPAHRLSSASPSEAYSTSCSPARRTVTPSPRVMTVNRAPSRPAWVSCPFSDRPA